MNSVVYFKGGATYGQVTHSLTFFCHYLDHMLISIREFDPTILTKLPQAWSNPIEIQTLPFLTPELC